MDETSGTELAEGTFERVPALSRLLLALLDAGGCMRIDAERRAMDQLSCGLETLLKAATQLTLPDSSCLADCLSTSARALRDGTMARALARGARDRGRKALPGYLLLFAQAVNSRAVYFSRSRPLAVPEGIEGDFSPTGPFIVLIECARDPFGSLLARSGYAQAVYGPDNLMPVMSQFEREVLAVLLALQERIEEHSATATIERQCSHDGLGPAISFRARVPGEVERLARIQCLEAGPSAELPGMFRATRDTLSNGALAGWLMDQLS